MKKEKSLLLIPLLLLGSMLIPIAVHPARAATGEVCLADPSTSLGSSSPCPASAPTFDGPVGQQIRVSVFIQGSDALNGFAITLLADHTILTPFDADLTGTLLPGTPTIVAKCVQDVIRVGSCASTDNVNTLDFVATAGLGLITSAPITGLLFTAVYNITGTVPTGGISVGYQTGCSGTSVAGGTCVTVSNGSTTANSETVQAASFDNTNPVPLPFVAISASPTSFGPKFPGVVNTATVTATAMNGYPSVLSTDSVDFTTVASAGLTATLGGTNPCATGGSSCSVTLSLSAAAAGNYFVTVFGTYATSNATGSPDTLVGTVTLNVAVDDFGFTVSPTSVSFLSGSSGSTTVTLSSLNGFAGTVTLSTGATIGSPPLTINYSPNPTVLAASGSQTSVATFTASPTVTTTYHATIKATSGTRVKTSSTLTLTVIVGTSDFSLTASPALVTIPAESNGTSTITVTGSTGFTGKVSLSSRVTPPGGLACAVLPVNVTGSGVADLLCTGNTSGGFNVTVTGTSGSLVHSVLVNFIVTSLADFSLSASPTTVTVPSGRNATSTISVVSLNGFTGTVTLNSISPLGLACALTVFQIVGSGTTMLSCFGRDGIYTVTVAGSSGSLSHSVTVTYVVTTPPTSLVCVSYVGDAFCPPPPVIITGPVPPTSTQLRVPIVISNSGALNGFDITLLADHTILKPVGIDTSGTVLQGTLTVLARCIGGSGTQCASTDNANTVHLAVVGTGITFPPTSGLLFTAIYNITGSSSLTSIGFQTGCVGTSVASGVCVTVANGSVTAVPESVQAAGFSNLPFFSLQSSSSGLVIRPGNSDNSIYLNVTSLNGFSGRVNLSTVVSPSGPTATVNPSALLVLTGGENVSVLMVSVGSSVPGGFYNITVTGMSGTLSSSVSISLTVSAPGFGISASPSSLAIMAGSSGASTITLTSLGGFSGNVSFAVAPFGPQISNVTLVPSVALLSSNGSVTVLLSIYTNAQGPTGSTLVTLTATSGTVSHTVQILVTVVAPPADFTLSASQSSVVLQQGSALNVTITLGSVGTFAGVVSLTEQVSGPTTVTPQLSAILQPANVTLTAGGSQVSMLTIFAANQTPPGYWTITLVGASGLLMHSLSISVQVVQPPDEPPVANFTVTPTSPVVGQQVEFNGAISFDPDGFIFSYSWDVGGNLFFGGTQLFYSFGVPGNYTVTLTVQDSSGLSGSRTMIVQVRPLPPHDVAILQLNVFPQTVVSTQTVQIQLLLENTGSNNETVSLTAYANGVAVKTLNGIFLQACQINPGGGTYCNFYYENIAWDTTGVLPGNYTISATVFLPAGEIDPTPSDNTARDGTVTVLAPPVVTVSPSSGVVGTKVLMHGSGFPIFNYYGYGAGPYWITFDDQFLGYGFSNQNGTFNFTFDVILAQPGVHQVIALDLNTGAHASTTFTVLAPTGNLAVTIDSGTVYFPGDTATAYILTSLNGVPTSSSQLTVFLYLPGGTNQTLSTVSLGTGLYRVTFAIPSSGTLGTYTILAKAHMTGPIDASSLSTFEVKLSWLSSNGKNVVGAATLAGVVGMVAVAWKKGYLPKRKKNGEPEPVFPF